MIPRLRRHAFEILTTAIAAVHPRQLIPSKLRWDGERLHWGECGYWPETAAQRLQLLAVGKAAGTMAEALVQMVGPGIIEGCIITAAGQEQPVAGCRVLTAAHPVPDQRSVTATEKTIRWLTEEKTSRRPLIVALSGGASAMFCRPAPGVTLEDKVTVTRALLRCGADIHELNCVRKHLSRVKGGLLARELQGRAVLTLILSDVPGDSLAVIASAPTVPDPSTFAEAVAVLAKYDLFRQLPSSVRNRLDKGAAGMVAENPGPGDDVFQRFSTLVVGGSSDTCRAAEKNAVALGYRPVLLSASMQGDTADCAAQHMRLVAQIAADGQPVPVCIISGGETTVKVAGDGLGGRNQEFVLHCVEPLSRLTAPAVVVAVGTDGIDGPTDAAGAMADPSTLRRAQAAGLDPLEHLRRNDSYHFFKRLNDLVVTGPTGTNVADLRLVLIG